MPQLEVKDKNTGESPKTWLEALESKYQEGDEVLETAKLTSAMQASITYEVVPSSSPWVFSFVQLMWLV